MKNFYCENWIYTLLWLEKYFHIILLFLETFQIHIHMYVFKTLLLTIDQIFLHWIGCSSNGIFQCLHLVILLISDFNWLRRITWEKSKQKQDMNQSARINHDFSCEVLTASYGFRIDLSYKICFPDLYTNI